MEIINGFKKVVQVVLKSTMAELILLNWGDALLFLAKKSMFCGNCFFTGDYSAWKVGQLLDFCFNIERIE